MSIPRRLILGCSDDTSWETTDKSLAATAKTAGQLAEDAAGAALKARNDADLAAANSKTAEGTEEKAKQSVEVAKRRVESTREAKQQAQEAADRATAGYRKAREVAEKMEELAKNLEDKSVDPSKKGRSNAGQTTNAAVTKARTAADDAKVRAEQAAKSADMATQEAEMGNREYNTAARDLQEAQAHADAATVESQQAAEMATEKANEAAKANGRAADAKAAAEKADTALKTFETTVQSADALPCGRTGIRRALDASNVGKNQVKLQVEVNSDWVERNDPFHRHPNDAFHDSVPRGVVLGVSKLTGIEMDPNKKAAEFSRKVLSLTLPGTDSLAVVPKLVLGERDRLHVLGMEYNPVYSPAPAKTGNSATTPPTPIPGTATATASGSGAGTTTITISGTGTASASSSGTLGTTATASAATTNAAQDKSSSPDPLTGCKQGQCAAILVKLAEPLDPNLVVTAKGLPLRRVRDWRGRATSVLPPAQSASDIAAPGTTGSTSSTTAAKFTAAENAPAASLLEADLPGPNTWMEVDSHRLLINISKDLVGESEEFPTIQIVDPTKRALFLPMDLDTGFSELIMNGFHFPTRDADQLQTFLYTHLRGGQPQKGLESVRLGSGPYPPETFLPLFLPQRDDQRIYAYLGETGAQILIGMEAPVTTNGEAASPTRKSWLAGKTQAVLEDRYLELAWSLSCYLQEPMLVCDVPREEVLSAYKVVNRVCSAGCPALSSSLEDFPSISTLQVWVEQYDPENDDSFYSAIPARLGRFPLSRGKPDKEGQLQSNTISNDGPDVGYSPWHFEEADQEWVLLTGCYYPNFASSDKAAVRILGRNIPTDFRVQLMQDGLKGCRSFKIPTLSLTNPEVVIEYPTEKSQRELAAISTNSISNAQVVAGNQQPPEDLCVTTDASCLPESLSTSQFQPHFDLGRARVTSRLAPDRPGKADQWIVDIPVGKADCNDMLNILDQNARFTATWKIGSRPLPVRRIGQDARTTCDVPDATNRMTLNWNEASREGQLILEFVIDRANILNIPLNTQIQILRGQFLSSVASAPALRSWIFPTKLKLVIMGASQFALEGDNAGVVDAVTVQGPEPFVAIPAASGAQIALVSLPEKAAPKPPPDTSKSNAPPKPTIFKADPPSGPANAKVTITGKNFGAKPTVVFTKTSDTNGVNATIADNCWNDGSILVNVPAKAQTGTGSITVKIGATTMTTPFEVKGDKLATAADLGCTAQPAPAAAKPSPSQTTPNSGKDTAPTGPKAGTYAVLPLIAGTGDRGKQIYLPLDVIGTDDKPLTFTVPDQSKDKAGAGAQSTDGPTTTLTITKKKTTTPAPTKPSTTPSSQ